MDEVAIRAIAATVVAVLLVVQARRAAAETRRQRSFALAAAAFVILALINSCQALGIDVGFLFLPALALMAVLLLLSLLLLVQAWQRGEMEAQIARVRQAVAEERERRKP